MKTACLPFITLHSALCTSLSPPDDLHVVVRGDDRRVGHPDEEAALDDAGQQLQLALGLFRVCDLAAAAVEYVVAVVGDVSLAALCATQERLDARDGGHAPRRHLPGERHDLDGERKTSERRNLLARVGDDDEAARRRRPQLLAQERAAAALDEREAGADLVRAVNGEVELLDFGEGGERDAQSPRLLFGA